MVSGGSEGPNRLNSTPLHTDKLVFIEHALHFPPASLCAPLPSCPLHRHWVTIYSSLLKAAHVSRSSSFFVCELFLLMNSSPAFDLCGASGGSTSDSEPRSLRRRGRRALISTAGCEEKRPPTRVTAMPKTRTHVV